MESKTVQELRQRIAATKQAMLELGDMRPGALSQQYNVCGNPRCACKDPEHPRKHGPYYQLSYSRHGKSKTEFVKRGAVDRIKREVETYKRFVALMDELIDLSIELSRLQSVEESKKP